MKRTKTLLIAILTILTISACSQSKQKIMQNNMKIATVPEHTTLDTATFGEGCFWCTEAFFQRLEGVYSVTSGYGGGFVENPTYEQVCDKNTGHVEIAKILFDPKIISYEELLEVFWKTHDPTTMDRQGNDIGPQYKSVIYFHTKAQQAIAEKIKNKLTESGAWENPIVTSIEPYKNFYPAESYHQNYYNQNPNQGYCRYVIGPKLEKFEKVFKQKIKKS